MDFLIAIALIALGFYLLRRKSKFAYGIFGAASYFLFTAVSDYFNWFA